MRANPFAPLRRCILALFAAAAIASWPETSRPQELAKELAEKLTAEQRRIYLDYRTAKDAHDKQHSAYWSRVEAKRDARRAKRLLGQAYDADDYVPRQPPKYAGPELPAEIG